MEKRARVCLQNSVRYAKKTNKRSVLTVERKVLRKMRGPIRSVNGEHAEGRKNEELEKLYKKKKNQ